MKITSRVTMQVRRNFAATHLQSAASAARKAREIEQNNDTRQFGDWFTDMMQAVPVAIVMAGAALETSANELMQNILDRSTPLAPGVGARLQLESLKSDRSGNSVGKYRRVAWLFDKEPDEGMLPWQNAEILVLARNTLMHFRPVLDQVNAASQESNLVKALKSKVPTTHAYKAPYTFPHSFMTYGCAKWSVETVLTFSEYFRELLGINDLFDPFRPSLELA